MPLLHFQDLYLAKHFLKACVVFVFLDFQLVRMHFQHLQVKSFFNFLGRDVVRQTLMFLRRPYEFGIV